MKRLIYTIISALPLVCSCADDEFLTEKPKYFYTLENAFSTSAQVDQSLLHCYSHLRNQYAFTKDGSAMFAFRGGNGTDMYDVPSIRHNFQFNDYSIITPERTEFREIYNIWYQLVSFANLTLYAASLDNINWDSEADREYVISQAKFFRAWAYRNLGEEFGGVPIVSEFCTSPRYDYVRSSRVETYQFAINDLEEALSGFPETSDERGRVVKGAAIHCLAQLYLDKGIALNEEGLESEAQSAYKRAEQYAGQLIEGGAYSLMRERFGTRKNEGPKFYYSRDKEHQTEDHSYESAGVKIPGNVIWDMFQTGNQAYQDGNRESIWIMRTEVDSYEEEDKASKLGFPRVFGACFRDPSAGLLEGTMEDVGGRGVAFVMPTSYTRDMIYEGKWGQDLRNSEAAMRRTFIGNVPGSKYYGKVIPWDVLYKKGSSQSVVDAAYTMCWPLSCKISGDRYPDDSFGGNKSSLFRDEYMIRLAETYLIRAEARMRMGNNAGAALDINYLRDRAKCSYRVASDDISLNLILDERARELVYEEIRWNTLLRMGGTVAVDRICEYAYWSYPRSGTMKRYNLWPIPQGVIDSNKDAMMEQNEGWK